jgi:hypothetical protein
MDVQWQATIFFPVEAWGQATDSYRAAYEVLHTIYGDPIIEMLPWSPKEDGYPPTTAHLRGYMTSWRTPQVSVMMDIGPNEQGEPRGWRAIVLEAQAK